MDQELNTTDVPGQLGLTAPIEVIQMSEAEAKAAADKIAVDQLFKPAVDLMKLNIASDVPDLNQLAATVSMSKFHFQKLFTKHFGQSPKQMQTKFQIDAVKQMLVDGVPMKEIPLKTNFSNQSHMTSRFKQVTGKTPKQWLNSAIGVVSIASVQPEPSAVAA